MTRASQWDLTVPPASLDEALDQAADIYLDALDEVAAQEAADRASAAHQNTA